jgi:hypothetical protein
VRFIGIVIQMYYNDHDPPHFHVRYSGRLALMAIEDLSILLKDPSYFRQVRAHPESGTVVWPNGADLDPDVLYAHLTGQPIKLDVARK